MKERIKDLAAEIHAAIEDEGEWTGHTGWLPETEDPAEMECIEVRYANVIDRYVITWGEAHYQRYLVSLEQTAEFVASLQDGERGLVRPEAEPVAADAPAEVTEERIKEVWKIIDETMLDMCSIVRVSRDNARINRERREREKAEGVTGWRRWRR